MGLKDLFKNAMKERINVEIIAGGDALNLTGKQLQFGVRNVSMMEGSGRGRVIIEIPFLSKHEWIIDGIDWEESGKRSAGKAAGGAIAGTLVAGPIGTIAGAAVGGRRKDTSKAFIYLINPDTNEEVRLHTRCNQDTYAKISRLI